MRQPPELVQWSERKEAQRTTLVLVKGVSFALWIGAGNATMMRELNRFRSLILSLK
jgi:hypothetical protein